MAVEYRKSRQTFKKMIILVTLATKLITTKAHCFIISILPVSETELNLKVYFVFYVAIYFVEYPVLGKEPLHWRLAGRIY